VEQPLLGVCMIVRDASKTIDALLNSILNTPKGPAYDEFCIVDTGSTDDTHKKIAHAFGLDRAVGWELDPPFEHTFEHGGREIRVVLASFKWIDDFSAARNFAYSLGTAKWRGYLDADDVFPDAWKLRPTLTRTEKQSPQSNVISLPYDYNGDGTLMQEKWRLVRWADGWEWQDEIHEHLERKPAGPRVHSVIKDLPVIHQHNHGHEFESLARNIRICRAVYEKALVSGDGPKAGLMLYYLGLYATVTPGQVNEGVKALEGAAEALGDSNISCEARTKIAAIYLADGNLDGALAWAAAAAGRSPELLDGHAILGVVQAAKGDHVRASITFDRFFATQSPLFRSAQDVVFTEGVVPITAAKSYLAVGRTDDATRTLNRVSAAIREHPAVRYEAQRIASAIMKRAGLDRVNALVEYLLWDAEPTKALELLDAVVPAAVSDSPEIAALRRAIESKLPHLAGWGSYKECYASIPEEKFHTAAEHTAGVRHLGRAKRVKEWAESLPKVGSKILVLSIGAQDCIIEEDVLAANTRIHMTVCDVGPQASKGIQRIMDLFPGRVSTHEIKENHYDWGDTTAAQGIAYDAVFIFEVLEHLPSDSVAMWKLHDLLAEGGTLFLSTPVADRWVEPYLTSPSGPPWFGHVRAHNPVTLWGLFKSCGFTGHLDATDGGGVFLAELQRGRNDLSEVAAVAIYVPGTPTPFDPDTPKTKHLGGSEEAVIHLSRELARRGHYVTVYAPRVDREDGIIVHARDGVRWRDVHDFDAQTVDGTVLYWRCPAILLEPAVKAANHRKVLWLHDTNYGAPKEAYEAADAVVVLSKTHAKTVAEGDGYEGPFVYAANGIDVETEFPPLTPGSADMRDPFKVVYGSSPERGLAPLLQAWPLIRAKVPQATLDIYYTWDLFERAMAKNPSLHERFGWLRARAESLKSEGVTVKGGVDHKTLALAYRRANVWAYPAAWFKEISCITAMKAQAAGCWPICTDHAALAETAAGHTSHFEPGELATAEGVERFAHLVVNALLVPPPFKQRLAMSESARSRFSWAKAADVFESVI